MATAGALNGTDVYVAIEDSPAAGTYTIIGGQNQHSITLNNNSIDITNKSSASFREIMDTEGIQSIDLTMDITYNTDSKYVLLRGYAGTKTIALYRIIIGALGNLDFAAAISSFGETSPDGDKLSNSITLQSSGTITWP
jgi:predicted secreted protein|tara:strand:- start:1860 stop:2276 length:417 start_codon:yes stop_codon:yes gene_type:complete